MQLKIARFALPVIALAAIAELEHAFAVQVLEGTVADIAGVTIISRCL